MGKATPGMPFEHVERQARRLQRLFLALILTVALLPGSIFVVLEVRHLRHHAEQEARQIAAIVMAQLSRSGPDLHLLKARLRAEMEATELGSVRLTAAGGGRLALGEDHRSFFPTAVTIRLPPSAGPFEVLRVEHDEGQLLRRAGRVFGVHFVVALVLLAVYRVQMRALRAALQGAKDTFAQLVHSDKLSAIGEMYAGLTHEINNPLGIVLSGVRLLVKAARERDLPRAELLPELETIDRHGSRIAETIRALLAFARRAPFELTATSLNGVISDAVALVERPFAKQRIRIETALEPSLPPVRGSHDHLLQVFVNLTNNSRDAMPDGGTIMIRTYRNGAGVVAEVADTGKGIPPDIRQRIFEPFFTTKDIGKGTGLGLSVSYGIVQAHQGHIEVESSTENGALFRVTLPLEDET